MLIRVVRRVVAVTVAPARPVPVIVCDAGVPAQRVWHLEAVPKHQFGVTEDLVRRPLGDEPARIHDHDA